jgi:hypothetical protein
MKQIFHIPIPLSALSYATPMFEYWSGHFFFRALSILYCYVWALFGLLHPRSSASFSISLHMGGGGEREFRFD